MVRIALCELPRLVEDILLVLLRDVPDVHMVGREDADLVICAMTDEAMGAVWRDELERTRPQAFLNLGPDSGHGDLYAVQPVRSRLEGLNARTLLEAVQAQAR